MPARFPTYIFLVGLLSLSSVTSILGGTSTRSVVAARVLSAPTIDGFLSDNVWQSAVPVTGFQQFDPDEGAPATEKTVIRILYDDAALYVGVMCHDSNPGSIVRQLTRRDRIAQADRVSVIIDSYHDHQTAFLFSGAVSGVQSDGILSQDGIVYDVQWDGVWNFNAQILPDGWSAEFRIPYGALRFTEQDTEYVWGINFRRFIARKVETDEWVMVPRNQTPQGTISSVSQMGHLSGITNIHPSLHLELLPYQVSKAGSFSQPHPFSRRGEFAGTLGLDLKYGVTNNFTFDVAINPDFGQVEVDQAVLNLSVFETFYPEKRPFFLEASQNFTFGNLFDNQPLRLFYSRRIGRKPFSPSPDSGFIFTQNPQTAKILAAGKLTGKTESGFTLGVLSALTDKEEGVEENISGLKKSVPFESRASYNVVRLKQDFLQNSSIGLMTTGSFHDESTPELSGGVDWNVRFDDGLYAFDGYLAGSRIISPLSGQITGTAGKVALGKIEGEHWLAFTSYDFAAPNFAINDLGFYNRPQEHGGFTQLFYKEDQAANPVRRYLINLDMEYRWNWEGVKTQHYLEIQPSWTFRNFWSLTLDYFHDLPAYDDASHGITGLYLRPMGDRLVATVQSDITRSLVFSLMSGYYSNAVGYTMSYLVIQPTVRPNAWLEFAPALTILRSRSDEAWTFLPNTSNGLSLFGDRDVDEYDFSLRGTLTFTRAISMQFFTQVFLAKGSYTNFKELAGPDNLLPYDHDKSVRNPDFNQKILNANFAFRWEYLPGSTFYLVWTQSRYGDNGVFDRSLSENFEETFRLPMDNVFLAKVSYWWSL